MQATVITVSHIVCKSQSPHVTKADWTPGLRRPCSCIHFSNSCDAQTKSSAISVPRSYGHIVQCSGNMLIIITSAEGRRVCFYLCLSVCLSPRLFRKLSTDFDENFGEVGCGPRNNRLDFCDDLDHNT